MAWIGPLIHQYASQISIPVELYAPYGTPPRELTSEFLAGTPLSVGIRCPASAPAGLEPAWVGLVEILRRIESQPYHWPVGRTLFQKIAYVATSEGLPTGLEYRKGSFGPFSGGLKNVQMRLVNDNLLREERCGRMFKVCVGSNYERVRRAYEGSLLRWSAIIDKTADLFARMDTNQAEVTATVLFAADGLKNQLKAIPTETQVLSAVMDWKQKRKPPLDEGKVASAIRNLAILHWLEVKYDPGLPLPVEGVV